jgi:hypothetical protein
MEQELAHAVNASSKAMDRVYGKPRAAEVSGLFWFGSFLASAALDLSHMDAHFGFS